ncbi:MAG: flagellar biosynthesis protein FliQ [Pseudobdellovibrionaceae bacterium]|uniref:flagellar biosynthesis protein FliQ n=1 Tax=Oligoflexus sp. TaxID=1971216 RepID=UPI0027BBDFC4|nr:flagellar biosynthesis protein FliQ [Oligoflexus sp.]MDQ3234129.1 flagellar biosynthesis protein FliQ [Pseudobdellovibrionaceae bacterium]HYX39259.1 flagellar biosynthesis protein FliQ [Oligoflexus sp.]
MTQQTVLDIGWNTIWVMIKISSPALLATLVMGLIVSIFQAATQINEQTLSFIPKILAMAAAMIVCGPWVLRTMMTFTINLIRDIPNLTH